jgi:Type II CAAX prenyl endopeptidase Rce1-like
MRAYWQDSRKPRYSLLLALPLFIIYQVLEALEPTTHGGGLRNGADVVLQSLFVLVAGPRGPMLFLVCLVAVGLWLVIGDYHKSGSELHFSVLLLMLAEAAVLALGLGIIVSAITSQLVRPTAMLQQSVEKMATSTKLMLSLGAGLYEELLFRVLLVGSLAWAGKRMLGLRPLVAGIWAALIGALIFSASHYVGPYGDRLTAYSFVFRTIAGLAFSTLFLLRGFGITAWTHALYDAFLLLR